ncbi:hypothetical protein RMSM_07169 [Rhodopirellula maiorica SM1]|uniref:Uncharacterized protein n=1 Tax=Rhodopirellula maiorica SM1 TaxID=1265738 RepID=M5RPM0_9BACT|nr:hypothetical protein RMSM_07169 [Rhodopirellula maiorica SM1]
MPNFAHSCQLSRSSESRQRLSPECCESLVPEAQAAGRDRTSELSWFQA